MNLRKITLIITIIESDSTSSNATKHNHSPRGILLIIRKQSNALIQGENIVKRYLRN